MNKYWMRKADSTDYAYLTGAAQRDVWTGYGYAESGEPGDTDFVWMNHPEIAEPARFPWASRDYWQARGFIPGVPPVPVDPTKDPTLTGTMPPPESPPAPAAKSPAEKSEKE